ncbi:hypothetical protein yc1106_03719 [Curvularia clavata]|uniref:Uncharacterized protein n=1 Tax=Curvularia clavata TaxID=95742 RepID=A0A9Q8Z769_CURCL|nr:hypothetical protein yc1106_03719 [Curvularia clavata]
MHDIASQLVLKWARHRSKYNILESLQLSPTVPTIAIAAKENTTLSGKYQGKANTPIVALFAAVHRTRGCIMCSFAWQ